MASDGGMLSIFQQNKRKEVYVKLPPDERIVGIIKEVYPDCVAIDVGDEIRYVSYAHIMYFYLIPTDEES